MGMVARLYLCTPCPSLSRYPILHHRKIFSLLYSSLLVIFLRAQKNRPYAYIGLPFIFCISSWINLYWGIFEVLLTGGLLYIHKKTLSAQLKKGVLLCCMTGLAIASYQWLLMTHGSSFSAEESFLKRATLDRFEIWPLSWNRLPWFSSIPPLIFGILIWNILSFLLNKIIGSVTEF